MPTRSPDNPRGFPQTNVPKLERAIISDQFGYLPRALWQTASEHQRITLREKADFLAEEHNAAMRRASLKAQGEITRTAPPRYVLSAVSGLIDTGKFVGLYAGLGALVAEAVAYVSPPTSPAPHVIDILKTVGAAAAPRVTEILQGSPIDPVELGITLGVLTLGILTTFFGAWEKNTKKVNEIDALHQRLAIESLEPRQN